MAGGDEAAPVEKADGRRRKISDIGAVIAPIFVCEDQGYGMLDSGIQAEVGIEGVSEGIGKSVIAGKGHRGGVRGGAVSDGDRIRVLKSIGEIGQWLCGNDPGDIPH